MNNFHINTPTILGLLTMSFLIIFLSAGQTTNAQPYSQSEAPYLQQLYSVMTELHQVGQQVSKNAIKLQSAPEEKCENEFGFYQGVVGSLRSKLSVTTPPPRLRALHVKSLEALSEYLTGLNLYGSACMDKDYAMKAKLVDRGSSYISRADKQVAEINILIANPRLVPKYATSENALNEWCISRWTNNIKMQEYCVATQTEARTKLANILQMNPKGTPGSAVIAKCTEIWTDDSGAYNYRMIVFCSENQIPR